MHRFLYRSALIASLTIVTACGASSAIDGGVATPDASARDAGPARDGGRADAALDEVGLPRRHVADPIRAVRGEEALFNAHGAEIPWLALRSLWVVWGQVGVSEEAYWSAFADRYGFVPRGGSELPFGVVRVGEIGTIQCLACHVDEVAGTARIGAGNGRLRLSALYEDLVTLHDVAPSYGFTVPPIPELFRDAFEGRTGAPGATDAFGMGMTLATAYDPTSGVETHYGFQQPPAWWSLAYKDRTYVDGSGSGHNFRTMLASTLASGSRLEEIVAMEDSFEDLRHFLLSLTPPRWPFDPPDPAAARTGETIFTARCAGCHGHYGGADASYPDQVVDVATDPIRHQRLTDLETTWINATWFGMPPTLNTEGYLAPPLLGVWATAPYLHNGSVPDLRAMLRPGERPPRWRRVPRGDDDYDATRVGVRFEPGTPGDPLTFDTTIEGLSSAGHDFGSDLSEGEVEALLAYLEGL